MRYSRIFLILLLVFQSACSTFSKEKESAALYLNLGASQLAQGLNARALKSLLNAKKLDDSNPEIHNHLGLTYFAMSKYPLAINEFNQALSLRHNYTEARNNLARTLIEEGQFEDARDNLRIVLSDLTYLNPAAAYFNLGLSYFREEKYKKAIPHFQKSIALNRDNCVGYNYYARSLYEMGDFKGANPVFESALPLCKRQNFDEAHYFAALSYFKAGNKSRGIALMNEAILQYPNGAYQSKARETLELMKLNQM